MPRENLTKYAAERTAAWLALTDLTDGEMWYSLPETRLSLYEDQLACWWAWSLYGLAALEATHRYLEADRAWYNAVMEARSSY